jgi:outer membrane protein OmpA-like peptidoglycan-associated protein
LIGGLIGGGTGRIIGAGIGGIAGAAVGYTMDKQIKELKEKTAGSGVDVKSVDDGQAILVNLPSGVTFDTDSTVIKPGFRDTLDKVADSLNRYPNSLIDVYGHTDSTGSDAYNQTLSENRARVVADYLSSKGCPRHASAAPVSARPSRSPRMIRPKAARPIVASRSRSCR